MVLTVQDFENQFPGIKDFCGRHDGVVQSKIDEALAFTDVEALGDQARYVVLRKARWLLHLDGCPFVTKHQADAFKQNLDCMSFGIGCRVL